MRSLGGLASGLDVMNEKGGVTRQVGAHPPVNVIGFSVGAIPRRVPDRRPFGRRVRFPSFGHTAHVSWWLWSRPAAT